MIRLRALGGLDLESSSFTQPKPLLLLSYLILEGPQQRRHLAELFWPEGQSRKSLSMTLTRLRRGVGAIVEADERRVWTSMSSDVGELLDALDKRRWQQAHERYAGAFVEGVVSDTWSSELEEWVYTTREYLAERVQYALLNLGEEAARTLDFPAAADLAGRAYRLPGLAGTEIGRLERLYGLLAAGRSMLAPEVRKEAEDYGLRLALTTDEARAEYERTASTPHNLVLRNTPFIGRDLELTEIATLLSRSDCRLLTLIGPGGSGKTRLALQIAHEQLTLGSYPDGVFVVMLESLTQVQLLPTHLARALDLAVSGQEGAMPWVAHAIGSKRLLVVLDNFEQLGAGANQLSELLAACTNLTLLVTSRERLRLEEEHLVPLEGLQYPEESAWEDAEGSDAIKLFVQRARQAQPHFELTRLNLPAVVRLCRLLEGSPLGLELAASWIRFMTCSELVAEIAGNLDFLTSSARNVPERQRSLRAVFESSWRLLSTEEQGALRRLSVFRAGFRREAAAEVAGATIPVLASLVDKSLLRSLPSGRYDRHSLLHRYTQEKLAAHPDEQRRVRHRHTLYFLALLGRQNERIEQGQQQDVTRVLSEEWENIRTVLETSLAERSLDALGRFVALMRESFEFRGALHEGLELLRRLETVLDDEGPAGTGLLGQVQIERAWYHYRLGAVEEARAAALRGLENLPAAGAEAWLAKGLNTLGMVDRIVGDRVQASAHAEQALTLARRGGDDYVIASVLGSLGILAGEQGNYDLAEDHYREAIALHRSAGRILSVIREMGNLAVTHGVEGELDEAQALQEESLRLAREIDFRQTMPYTLSNLGVTHALRGNHASARDLNLEALEIARETGQREIQVGILNNLVGCMAALSDYGQGLGYSIQAIRLAQSIGAVSKLLQSLLHRGDLCLKMGESEQAATLLFFVAEHPATVDFERRRARALLDELAPRMRVPQFRAIELAARTVSLAELTEGLRLERG